MSTGMFLGTHYPRLDDKGRLVLPAKFRARLAAGLVMTKGRENCLFVYPVDEFVQMAAGVQSGPTSSKGDRDLTRMLLSAAAEELPDKQGRITIPGMLREYAGLGRDVAVVGTGNRAEIWDAEAWNSYVQATDAAYAETAKEAHPEMF